MPWEPPFLAISVWGLSLVGVGRFQVGDDDPGHLVHRLPYPVRLLAVLVSHEPQRDLRNDLPVDAVLVGQPATGFLRAAAGDERLVVVVGLSLVPGLDVEREPLVEGRLWPSV